METRCRTKHHTERSRVIRVNRELANIPNLRINELPSICCKNWVGSCEAHGSPFRTASSLFLKPETYNEDDSPRPKFSAIANILNRERMTSMHPGSGESGATRGSWDPKRTSFAQTKTLTRRGQGRGEETLPTRRKAQRGGGRFYCLWLLLVV